MFQYQLFAQRTSSLWAGKAAHRKVTQDTCAHSPFNPAQQLLCPQLHVICLIFLSYSRGEMRTNSNEPVSSRSGGVASFYQWMGIKHFQWEELLVNIRVGYPGCLQYFRKMWMWSLVPEDTWSYISVVHGNICNRHSCPWRSGWSTPFISSRVHSVFPLLCAGVNRSYKAAQQLNAVLMCRSIDAFHLFLALGLGKHFLRNRRIWFPFVYVVITVWNQYLEAMVQNQRHSSLSCHHHLRCHWLVLAWSSGEITRLKKREAGAVMGRPGPVPARARLLARGRRSSGSPGRCRNASAAAFLETRAAGQAALKSNAFRWILIFFIIMRFFTFQIEPVRRKGVFPVDLFTQHLLLAAHLRLSHVFAFSPADVYNYSLKCFHFLWSLNVNEVTFLKIIVAFFSGQKPCC